MQPAEISIAAAIANGSAMITSFKKEKIAVLGAGISGLSTAWLLKQHGCEVQVFESSSHVGGLARSFDWCGVRCDLAPHRLFTNDHETLETMMRLVPMNAHRRKSKIFMHGQVIRDPINPMELVLKFPATTSFKLVWGFLFRPKLPEDSFESMALNNFGRGLYDFFFQPYTYKLFGVSPRSISAAWGKQKLRSSGLFDAIKRNSKTFFKGFYYPVNGGYQAISDVLFEDIKNSVLLNAKVTGLVQSGHKIEGVKYQIDGQSRRSECDRVISTIPITNLGEMLGHEVNLRFKPIKIVYLHIDKPQVMPYHWIYFGDGDVVINRMAEFKNFSDDHSSKDKTVLCAEVTVSTDNPIEDAIQALEKYNLVDKSEVLDSLMVPIQHGYPIYEKGYEKQRSEALGNFDAYENLHLVGRNAEFRHIDIDENFASAKQLVTRLYGHIGKEATCPEQAHPGQKGSGAAEAQPAGLSYASETARVKPNLLHDRKQLSSENKNSVMKPVAVFLLVAISIGALLFWIVPGFDSLFPSLYNINHFPDGYDKIAMNLVQGHGYRFFPQSAPTMVRTPLYPLVLASVFYLFGKNLAAAQALNLLLTVLTAYFIYQIFRLCLQQEGKKIQASFIMIPAIVFMLHPGVILAESRGGVECLLMFLITVLVYYLYKAVKENSVIKYAVAGMVFGLVLLTKSSPVLFAFGLIGYILWLRNRLPIRFRSLTMNCCAFFLVCAAVYTPWIVRNYNLTGHLVPASTIKGFVAHQGLYLNQNYFSGKPAGLLFSEDAMQQNSMVDKLALKTYKRGYYKYFYTPNDELKFDDYLWDDVLYHYKRSPLLAAKSVMLNAFGFWFKGRTTAATMLNVVITFPLLILFVMGLSEAYTRKINILPIILFVIAFIIPHLFTLGLTRYHIPIIPLLIIVAALPFQPGGNLHRIFSRVQAKT